MNLLTDIPFELDREKIFEQWQIDENSPEDAEEFGRLIETARRIGRPKALWLEFPVGAVDHDTAEIGGRRFTSRMLASMLKGKDRVYLYCATCGKESDALLDPADPLLSWRADELRMILLAAARQAVESDVKQRRGAAKLVGMAPGSGQTEQVWSITALRDLFEMAQGAFSELLGVELTENCLMLPAKTVCGVLFASEHDFQSCMVCQKEKCPNRRAPFDQAAWEAISH